jgi:multidrug efflux pump subunit AcrA (membrane-fusion protein)
MKLLPALLLAVGLCLAATLNLGSPLALKQSDPVDKIASAPASYVGKTIQVKGKITKVCQMMGCWMNLADPETGKLLKIKVNDGDIVFPKDSAGKLAIAEGKLVKIELTREQAIAQARHEAREQGRKFNPASIKSGATIYQIQGTGALILE